MLPPPTPDQLRKMRHHDHDSLELRTRTPEEAARFVTAEALYDAVSALTEPETAAVFEDKLRFDCAARALALPLPDLVAVHDEDDDVAQVHEVLASRAPAGVVVKPTSARAGRGVVVFERVTADGRSGTTVRRRRRPVQGALSQAAGKSEHGRVILQELLRQHPDLDAFAPHPLSTVRAITLLRHDRTVRFLGAFLRLGRAGAMTDNVSRGGVAVEVDVESGVLGCGILQRPLLRMDRHPEGAEPFRGRRLPFWDDVVALCTRAAPLLPGVRMVGWDVMITATGPRLIEANWDVRLRTLQAVRGAGLLSDDLVEDFRALGVSMPPRAPVLPDAAPPWPTRA